MIEYQGKPGVRFGIFQHRIVQYRIHNRNTNYTTGNKVALQLVENKCDVEYQFRPLSCLRGAALVAGRQECVCFKICLKQPVSFLLCSTVNSGCEGITTVFVLAATL